MLLMWRRFSPLQNSDPAQALDLVLPSLPGFGFSGKPTATGWGVERIARAWGELMTRLGYTRWFAQGGDWGSAVTTAIGVVASFFTAISIYGRVIEKTLSGPLVAGRSLVAFRPMKPM